MIKQKRKVFPASFENIKPLGRTHFAGGVLWCAYSGTGAEFSFRGTSAKITIRGDGACEETNTDSLARVAVYLNGRRVIDSLIDRPVKTYTVFEADEETDAVITVVKLSESMSVLGIKEIEIVSEGIINPTRNKETFIEFIGDSITCGYGVDDEDAMCHFSTASEDFTKTYAYKTAEELGADYSAVSLSGYGIISGYTQGDMVPQQTIPQYYAKLGFSSNYAPGFCAQDTEWGFLRKPDIIVINLGTNDDSYCRGDKKKQDGYSRAYGEFLAAVRGFNPDSKIICSLGIMGDRLYKPMESAVKRYTAETKDANVTCMRFDEQQAEDGFAADFHPTEATHIKAARKLINEIVNYDVYF